MTMSFVLQDGTSENDGISTAVATGDGSAVLAGFTYGLWNGTTDGSYDFAAVKLDANGTVQWRWQVGEERDSPRFILSYIVYAQLTIRGRVAKVALLKGY